jgi:nitrogen fixation/metabolism regulation signal transduction histidine kinase
LERRRRYLIDRGIQISFLKFVLALLVVVSIFFSFLMLHINRYLTDYIMLTVEEIAKNPNQEMSSLHLGGLKKEFVKKDIIFVLEVCFVVLLLGAIIGLLTIRFTHRLAGPIYRMHTALDKALKGDFSPRIVLRKKDLLKDLVDKLNDLIESIDKRSHR